MILNSTPLLPWSFPSLVAWGERRHNSTNVWPLFFPPGGSSHIQLPLGGYAVVFPSPCYGHRYSVYEDLDDAKVTLQNSHPLLLT